MKKKIIILGAGISGLTIGYLLKKHAAVTILEKSSKPGGSIHTINHEGFLFELGARSCRTGGNGRYTLKLIEELGLTDQIITANAAAKKRYLFVNNKLQKLPTSPLSFITSPLTRPLALPLLREPWISPSQDEDESIHNFISRRLGDYAANTLFNPLTLGIYAGDTHKLSIKSCFPNLHEWEQTYRSLIRGAFKSQPAHPITSPFIESLQKQPLFTFKKGMQTLTDALAKRLDSNILYNSSVTSIEASDKGVTLNTSNETLSCDHLYLCIPAHQLTPLFPQIPTIETASVVTATIGYKHYTLKEEGFGHLVPSQEKEKTLGIVWDSSVFPEHNQHPQETRLTVMMGGAHYPDLINESEQTLETLAIDALRRHLSITTSPDTIAIHYAKNAIPQYHVGHAQRVEKIERQLPNNITLLGNSFKGVAINDCIANAYQR